MGWLESLRRFFFGETRNAGAAGWEPWGTGGASRSDPMTLVAFFASIRHIVDFMSTLPIDSLRKDGEKRVPAPMPALFRRLNEPGDIGVEQWVGQWAYGVAVHGNAVGWVTAVDGFGYPIGIRWLAREDWQYDEWTKQWWVFGVPAPRERIVHSAWIVPPGKVLGLSPVEHFQTFWRAGISAQEYADVNRGGGVPPSTLKNTAQKITPEDAVEIQSRAVRSFQSGKPFVSGNDWDLTITEIPPNQKLFLESLQLNANQTAAIFGIDPREIGGAIQTSLRYETDESRSLNRANNMRPYLVRFERMVERLLPERQFVRLNADATIRTDIKTRIEIEGLQIKDGRMSVNEARALEDRPPVPGGDFYNVPAPSGDQILRQRSTEGTDRGVRHQNQLPALEALPTQEGDTP